MISPFSLFAGTSNAVSHTRHCGVEIVVAMKTLASQVISAPSIETRAYKLVESMGGPVSKQTFGHSNGSRRDRCAFDARWTLPMRRSASS